MDLASLYRRLSEYQSFKNEVEGLVAALKNAVDPLIIANKALAKTYLYDDYVADKGKLNINKNNLDKVIRTLENNILPEIDRKISSINRSIETLESEAMEE